MFKNLKIFIKKIINEKKYSLKKINNDDLNNNQINNQYMDLEKILLRQCIKNKWEIIDYLASKNEVIYKSNECPLCNCKSSNDSFNLIETNCIFGGGKLKRYQCPECNLIYGPLKMLSMSDVELNQEYEMHYKVYEEGDSTDAEIKAFFMLGPMKSGIYLNYGAGNWSKSVNILRNDGWNIYAYEPHISAAKKEPYFISDKKELSLLKFDGIYTNNVLEHLKDPINDINVMKSLLKVGGKLSHATPCYEYLYEYTRFHLYFYLGRSKEILSQKTNMKITNYVKQDEFMCMVLENN